MGSSKTSQNLRNDQRLNTLLKSLVGGPRSTVLQGGHKAPLVAVCRGLQQRVPCGIPGFPGGFRSLLEGTCSNLMILIISAATFKLWDFRKRRATCEMTSAWVPRSSRQILPGSFLKGCGSAPELPSRTKIAKIITALDAFETVGL